MKLLFGITAIFQSNAAWRALLLAFVVLAASVTLWHREVQFQVRSVRTEDQKLAQTHSQAPSQTTAIAQDFLGGLSQVATSQTVVDTFQRAAREAAVAAPHLSLRQIPARADQLGRVELTVTVQGSYSALKQLLAEWLDRFPSATVRAQQWRRIEQSGASGAGPTTVEANWVLSVWTCPIGIKSSAPLLCNMSQSTASTSITER